MIGLMFLVAALLYFALLIFATWLAYRLPRKRGWSRGLSSAVAVAAFLAIYLPVFWDHIPTVTAHQRYCSKEAGFTVSKSVEQWGRENPDAVAQLIHDPRAPNVGVGDTWRWPLNQRIVSEYQNPEKVFLTVTRREARIIDIKNGEILARFVDFRAGPAALGLGGEGWWKVWLRRSSCDSTDSGFEVPFSEYRTGWIKLTRGNKASVSSVLRISEIGASK